MVVGTNWNLVLSGHYDCMMRLVVELEVQPLITSICCGWEVVELFFRSEGIPDLRFGLVSPDIVQLYCDKQKYVENADPDQDPIATSVQGSIICSIDIWWHDSSYLNHHVVNGRANCSCSYSVGVDGVPSHKYWVAWKGSTLVIQSTRTCTHSNSYCMDSPPAKWEQRTWPKG